MEVSLGGVEGMEFQGVSGIDRLLDDGFTLMTIGRGITTTNKKPSNKKQ